MKKLLRVKSATTNTNKKTFKPCGKWLHKKFRSKCGKKSPFGDFIAYCSFCYQKKRDYEAKNRKIKI